MSVVKKAVDLIATQGKKIASNLSVDGGIEGLSKQVIKTTDINMHAAAKVAKEAALDSERVAAISKRASAASSAMEKVASKTSSGKDALLQMNIDSGLSPLQAKGASALGVGREYFSGGTKTQNYTRRAAAAGAYMGVNIAGRTVTGGSLGYNREGQRDIAGIPMI